MPGKNIRRHNRIVCQGPVRISWQAADGPRFALGKCMDVSAGGLRIECLDAVPVRTMVLLNVERLNVSGSATVKHVARRGAKCVVGLELSATLLEKTIARAAEAAQADPPVSA